MMAYYRIFLVVFIIFSRLPDLIGQPTQSYDLKKPKKFENKTLGSEKTGEKKLSISRAFVQNTVTHYNWYFNANYKLDQVIDRAKSVYRDDYTRLLPFYNYSLETTMRDSTELDSVIIKSNAGILIHDLRNSWIDNLFMLMGKAYFFKKEFDSAYITFQYINYAWSPKEKDGYQLPIGSNASENGNSFIVSTKENRNLVKKAFSTAPSRNESLLWQIKTFLEMGDILRAAGLIQTLRNDPVFPGRLQTDLDELTAYRFYIEKTYDSAAIYLEHALENSGTRNERARWEFLIGQLLDLAGNHPGAQEFFQRSVRHTLDPVMEVYGRLNSIRQNKSDSVSIQKNIDQLLRMGRKDKYSRYRDIIYYTAAEIELDRQNYPAARKLLLKATKFGNADLEGNMKTKAFLLLGDLAFEHHEYPEAKMFYDSINIGDPIIKDPEAFAARNELLTKLIEQTSILQRQDSLQNLAAMPAAERDAYLKKLVRKMRKMRGLREDENQSAPGKIDMDQAPADLFQDNAKGQWYFYNNSLKSKGYSAFKARWGNRPNVDNWQRISAVKDASNAGRLANNGAPPGTAGDTSAASLMSYEALLKNIPLEPAQMAASNDSIQNAKVSLAKLHMENLEDYQSVIVELDSFAIKYPGSPRLPEALYYLYYSLRKTGNDARAGEVMQLMQKKFPGNPFERQITNASTGNAVADEKTEMTKSYEAIYRLFIEGKFEDALALKQEADGKYGNNYWTPQLLYIESIYYIRQRDDQQATKILQQLLSLYHDSPMKDKVQTLLDVLGRRKEIETYLTNLQIERPQEDSLNVSDTTAVIQKKPAIQEPVIKEPVPAEVNKQQPVVQQPAIKAKDSVAAQQPGAVAVNYSYHPESAHVVVMVANNVDPVYVTESRNAFNRYNQTKYYNKVIEINNVSLNDTMKLVVISSFENAKAAEEYLKDVEKQAPSAIIPWLPADKYSFMLMSTANLEVLKNRQNVEEYRSFLKTWYK